MTSSKTAVRAGHAAISVKTLRQAMKAANAVVERRSTVPVMACVLLTVGPSTMTVTASDLDLQLEQQLDLDGAGSGRAMEAALEAGVLEKICAKLDSEAVLTLDRQTDGRVKLSCGRTQFMLPALPADDFPLISGGDLPVRFSIARGSFQQLLEAVAFAQSTEETRYYMNGVFLHIDAAEKGDERRLIAATTDGHRLALMSIEAPEGAEGFDAFPGDGVIISRKTVAVLLRLLDASGAPEIELAFSQGKMMAEIGAMTMVAKLIDATFPDYRRVVPTAHKINAWVDPKAPTAMVDRARTIATDKVRAVRFDMSAAGTIKASVSSPENGSAEEEIEATIEGGDLTIGFNSNYLIEILNRLTASPALMQMSDCAGPVLLLDSEDAHRRFVLMPLRV